MLKKIKIKKGEKFGMPGWMECTWRRVIEDEKLACSPVDKCIQKAYNCM